MSGSWSAKAVRQQNSGTLLGAAKRRLQGHTPGVRERSRELGPEVSEMVAKLLQAPESDTMIVFAPGIPRDARRPVFGLGLQLIVIVQHHHNGACLRNNEPRILATLRLAVQITHRAGIASGKPLVQPVAVRWRARIGDPACEEAEIGGALLDGLAETHGEPARAPTAGALDDAMSVAGRESD